MPDRKRMLITAGIILSACLLAPPALAEDWTAVTGQQSLTELIAGATATIEIREGVTATPRPERQEFDL